MKRIRQFEQLENRQMLTVAPEFVADIRPGGLGSKIGQEWVTYQDEVYFTADDGASGRELWKSDGTEAGTQRVKDIFSGPTGSAPAFLTPYNGELYFSAGDASAGDELWKTDGTSGGTQRVVNISAGADAGRPRDLTLYQGDLFFSATEGSDGAELWRSDGTPGGTRQVSDIYPGEMDSDAGSGEGFIEFNELLYFLAEGPDIGIELYRTNGTDTELVLDADNGDEDSLPTAFTIFQGDLYFIADVPIGVIDFVSFVYRVDGVTGDVEQFFAEPVDVREGLTVAGDTLYFAGGGEATGIEVYSTDGTKAGTQMIRDIFLGEDTSRPQNFFAAGDELYFSAGDAFESGSSRVVHQLWVTRGTPATTRKVSTEVIDQHTRFASYRNEVFYLAQTNSEGWELFRTNGTAAGTQMVADVNPGSGSSFGIPKIVFEDQLLFLADNGTNGFEIWTWDGVSAEMAEVHQGGGGFTEEPSFFSFGRFGNDLIFRGSTPFEGDELFIIRGTGANQLAGDADGNGVVEFADFLVLSANFNKTNTSKEQGDFNGDRVVDFSDFLILSANFGKKLS